MGITRSLHSPRAPSWRARAARTRYRNTRCSQQHKGSASRQGKSWSGTSGKPEANQELRPSAGNALPTVTGRLHQSPCSWAHCTASGETASVSGIGGSVPCSAPPTPLPSTAWSPVLVPDAPGAALPHAPKAFSKQRPVQHAGGPIQNQRHRHQLRDLSFPRTAGTHALHSATWLNTPRDRGCLFTAQGAWGRLEGTSLRRPIKTIPIQPSRDTQRG